MAMLINLALMQVSWFACVLGAANDLPWAGVLVTLAVVAWHLLRTTQPRKETMVLLGALVVGVALDSALASSGLMTFTSGTVVTGLTTPWMLSLWLGFATTLNASLRWLMTRPLLAVLFGAAGGPLAYFSGAKLGAIGLNGAALGLLCIGLGWAGAMGFFVLLTKRTFHAPFTRQVPA
jgi:hypothetical protein